MIDTIYNLFKSMILSKQILQFLCFYFDENSIFLIIDHNKISLVQKNEDRNFSICMKTSHHINNSFPITEKKLNSTDLST